MEDQPRQPPQAGATQELRDLSSTRGPTTAQVLRVVTLVLLGGVLLLLAGFTLAGTLIGLALTAPLFTLFSPVLISAVLTIGLAVAGFLTSVAFGVTALFFFTLMVNYLRRTGDAGAPTSSTSPKRSDSEPSASADNGKGNSIIVVNQRQENDGKSTRRKADDTRESSSSTTSTGSNNYDVFLSFRGLDTRKQFTDHLYKSLIDAGISVFRDENELPQGEDVGTNLLWAIKNSKISIPVLSQNYASSKWCLQELVQMVEGMKSGHIVLPIFYHVEPADVRYQKGIFGGTFSRLSGKYVEEDVAKWTQALQEVASLKGWDSKTTANGYEGELVELVVAKVLSELKTAFQLVVTEQLVGINNAVKDVLRLLDDDPNATRIVGIHGMGGIGKTTLAKVVYNKLSDQFRDRSFIADIRESSRHKGVSCLQNQLILDILKSNDQVSNTDEGIRIMESRFKCKKVLILLDDVDENDQLKALVGKHDWFQMGSRIIITTRKRSVLDDAGVNCKYELKEITMDESMVLFSRHAFRRNSPPCEFKSLSQEVVTTTRGLPLALEVIGSFLCGKNQAFWQETLEELKEVPHEKVQEKLRISYEALNYKEKQIFLDIACFFIGTDLRIASYMWDDCNLRPARGIERLSFMSLIKIGDNHELRMHDQLRDLGREIARQEDYDDLMNRSRLWVYEEALNVLQTNKENKKIKALRLDKIGSSNFMEQESFKRLPNLKFLHVSAVDSAGDLEISLSELRWLKWERYPDSFKMTNVHLEKLLIIELSGGNIRENWGGWSLIKIERLKVLNLSGCSQLKTTPNLFAFESLEMLILENCPNLEKIHSSIGNVKCLVSLNLNICKKLKKLPDSLGALGKLRHLSLVRCYVLKEIPSSIGELGELVELDLSSTRIKELPESIKKLKKLEILRISHSEIERLPSAIGQLVSLQELDASGCHKLQGEILVDIGGLSFLRTLRLGRANISLLPENFHELSALEHLDSLYCSELQSLPEPPSRLSFLQLTCLSPMLPSLSHLRYLKTLTLHLCTSLESIPELPSYIQKLRVSKCPKLKTLPNLSNLKSLLELELLQCYGLTEFDGLEGLESLRKLDVSTNTDSSNLDDLEDLESLKYSIMPSYFGWEDNLHEIRGLGQLISLEVLNISARRHIKVLDLTKSKHLKRLIVNGCQSLIEIRCHDKIESLERFDWDRWNPEILRALPVKILEGIKLEAD